ncbi:MAG TPA: hypothetical protein VGQ09_16860 [Chitinophagaceae bacterium]|nr:hypothetical protein [Chitinophagaceae bacterium]
MKRCIILAFISILSLSLFAQNETKKRQTRQERRDERQQRINALIKQEEEGALIYNKQSVFGIELRTNGYGLFYELGKAKTRRKTNVYSIELTEIKDPKEEKTPTGFFTIGNPYIFGKINNFYQLKFGFGQQYLFGQKGNKNGVAVTGTYQGGLSLGFLRPYYLNVDDGSGNRQIKYSDQDSSEFLNPQYIQGSSGLGKGWSELKLKPGAFAKAALRFDWGHYNEIVSGIEIGLSVEAYAQKIPILLFNDDRQFFFQGHLAIVFGRRK